MKLKLEAAENQTTKKFAESEKNQVDENSSYKSNHEDDKEIMEKEEPQLEAEDHKEQSANETTKAVILTEKVGKTGTISLYSYMTISFKYVCYISI